MIGDARYEGLLDDAEREVGGVIASAGQAASKAATQAQQQAQQQVQQTVNQVTGQGSGGAQQGVTAPAAAGGGFPWALALGGGAVGFGLFLVWLKRR